MSKPAKLAISLIPLLLSLHIATAMYVRPDLINIPVERLIANLEQLVNRNPRDAYIRLNLARAHAMAYSLKTDTAQVWKGKENEGVWFGYEPRHVPFDVKPASNNAQRSEARAHLEKAIAQYEEAMKLDPDNLTIALGHAWCIDQYGDKQKAIAEYRRIIDVAWQKEKDRKTAGLGWHPVTAEAAEYLIPLLDAEKDREEIATLRQHADQVMRVPRPITPIVIPLDSEDSSIDRLEDPTASVRFDADGTGLKKSWTWVTPRAGWLVFDPHKTSAVTSALQMFGNVTFWMFWDNGYQAMSALDDNRDGLLSGGELFGLAVWQDLNRNGQSDPGEVQPLRKWGIVALSCAYVRDETRADRMAYSVNGVVFSDGTTRPTYDLILRPAISSLE